MSLPDYQDNINSPVQVTLRLLAENLDFPTVIKAGILPKKRYDNLFVTTQSGKIYILAGKNYEWNKLWLDISDKVNFKIGSDSEDSNFSERKGLIGFEFHPDFYHNGKFYLYYTLKDTNISESPQVESPDPSYPDILTQTWNDRNQYDHINILEEWEFCKISETSSFVRTLLKIKIPFANNNNIDSLHWYSDLDRLILCLGDGGFKFDVFNLAQSDDEILGKILSINVHDEHEFSGEAITRMSEIPNPMNNSVQIVAKGIQNPVGWIEYVSAMGKPIKIFAVSGENFSDSIYAFKNYHQPLDRLLNFGWRIWEGSVPTTKDGYILYGDEIKTLSDKIICPIINLYKEEDLTLSSIAQYQGSKIKELYGSIVFSKFSESGQNKLYYSCPNLDGSQKFNLLNVDFSETVLNENLKYIVLGNNFTKKRIFLGVIKNNNKGAVYEIIHKN